jgi:hypothetical protein
MNYYWKFQYCLWLSSRLMWGRPSKRVLSIPAAPACFSYSSAYCRLSSPLCTLMCMSSLEHLWENHALWPQRGQRSRMVWPFLSPCISYLSMANNIPQRLMLKTHLSCHICELGALVQFRVSYQTAVNGFARIRVSWSLDWGGDFPKFSCSLGAFLLDVRWRASVSCWKSEATLSSC